MKLTKAQISALSMLDAGYPIDAIRNPDGTWKPECEYLPYGPFSSTMRVLLRKRLVSHTSGSQWRRFYITPAGRAALERK